MKNVTTVGMIIGTAMLVGSAGLSAQWDRARVPRTGACFYEHANFGGQSFCAEVGDDATRVPNGADDEISSIRIYGNASVTVYQDSAFKGRSRTFTRNVRDLQDENFNDRITSYRVDAGGYSSGDWNSGGFGGAGNAWGRPQFPRAGVCFFEDRNFNGDYFCSTTGTSARRVPPGTNNRITSIRVFGNAEVRVYQDENYRGSSRVFNVDSRNLRSSGWDDVISSYQVLSSRGGNNYGGAFGGGSHSNGSWQDRNNDGRMSYTQAQAIVTRAYRRVLQRDPDPGSAGYVTALMNGNLDERGLEEALVNSQEYKSKVRR